MRRSPLMGNGSVACVYRPRRSHASLVWQCLSRHFEAFLEVYEERYQARYGLLRPVVPSAVAAFLKCGGLHKGFARVRWAALIKKVYEADPLTCHL